MVKLCLNMIVKNESKIITRLFDSVSNIIDSYLICDTGSTDNTVELITSYFDKKGIPGKVIVEPFKDFGYNRTYALKACDPMDADYILLLDADMILEHQLNSHLDVTLFKQSLLNADVHYMFQGSPRFMYKNVRIVKNKANITYWGVTHEVIQTPEGTKYGQIERDVLFINDVGDGGAKADKFERDIRLLTQGLVEKPNNDRYTFYLANSLRDYGDREKAIEMYKKRIEIGGWFDEVWQSYYNIGRCYKWMGQTEMALHWFQLGYDYFPKRVENIYEIVHHYRQESKHKLAYEFYRMARKQLDNVDLDKLDYLFMQNDIYDWKLDYEFSITGYYWNPDRVDMAALCTKVMSAPTVEDSVVKNVMSNYKFYTPKLTKENFSINIPSVKDEFVSSTPTFCMHDGKLVALVRYVNYYIDDNGGYVNREYITTHNVVSVDGELEPWTLKYNTDLDCRYKGLEDVRLFEHKGLTYFTANRGLADGTMRVEYGSIDYENKCTKSTLLSIPEQRHIEKNWVLYADANGGQRVVYGWAPFTTYAISENGTLSDKQVCDEVPPFFEHLRGSTHGISVATESVATESVEVAIESVEVITNAVKEATVNNSVLNKKEGAGGNLGSLVWFICHMVSYEERRYYYHVLVAIDPKTNKVKRWSKPFTLDGEKVEYVLGFIQTNAENFLIGYSTMDKTTRFAKVSKGDLEQMFVSV